MALLRYLIQYRFGDMAELIRNDKKEPRECGVSLAGKTVVLSDAFLLNYRLKERLKEENRARIIYVNFEGHRFALAGVHLNDLGWEKHFYTGLKSYRAAKTAQLLTTMNPI